MTVAYILLEDAAKFESVDYETMKKRIQRNPTAYETQESARESGKARVLVAVSSLSGKAQKLYRAAQRSADRDGETFTGKSVTTEENPWYVDTDFHRYLEQYPKQVEAAGAIADLMREFGDYAGRDRTGFAKEFAAAHGLSQRTLYRHAENYLAASAWALKYERLTGANYDFFKILALCRKPKTPNTFPSVDPEIKAFVENIWFDKMFRENRGTVQMLYEKLEKKCGECGMAYPSYQTIVRYIHHLMDHENGSSAAYLAERGTRDWKNKYMQKAERDIRSLAVMEIVMGDVHTLDFFVKYTPKNGRPIAIRPKLISWMDVRSRRYVSYSMCKDPGTDDIKNSFAKGVREHGAPKHLLIDNGKDFSNRDTLGHDRRERLIFNDDFAGFYKSMGVRDVFRSLPFQPWDKGQLERSFGTVCDKFSRWFASYTGTLTGSKTSAKIKKDINGMLERGELYTMEEVFALWDKWVHEVYDKRVHRGLKDSGETHHTPIGVWENADNRYTKAAPPDSYIAMLLMRSKRVPVRTIGIRHNKRMYMCEDLQAHINGYVHIRYKADDDTAIFAFDGDGKLIGEIPLAEKLNAHFYADEAQVAEHKSRQNRQLRVQRETLDAFRTPFDQRPDNADATPKIVGGIDLVHGKQPQNNVVELPMDAQYRQIEKSKTAGRKAAKTEYYDKRGQAVLDKLNTL